MIAARLRALALEANLELAASGLVMGTFGNLSVVDRDAGLFVIKPSGVPYNELTAAHMVPVSLESGEPLETAYRPSSDTPTHVELYRAFDCGAVVHTHSEYATMFAQTRTSIRCMGTTHADYFHGDVPVTRALHDEEIAGAYEKQTGLVIVETFREAELSPLEMPAVLVANHAPFTWGATTVSAIEHARVLEYVARLEWRGRLMAPDAPRPDRALVDRHYFRKHGGGAYYGQP